MYNSEKDDQIFIQLDPEQEPVEFLLDKQPLEMIRAGLVTKYSIRETVETGIENEPGQYSKTWIMEGFNIVFNIDIELDDYLQIIGKIEKLYY